MSRTRALGFLLIFTAIIFFLFLVMQPLEVLRFRNYIAVLFPKGFIGIEERNLLLFIQVLMLLVIFPVYIFTFIFSWKYRADNEKATYDPDLVDNKLAEVVWWGLPFLLTFIAAVATWIKTYELDPFRPIESDKKPMTIQVVALQWKWLFIYPEEKIATVNFVEFPIHTPIKFEITADAPMNSFWIPHLGGQIYAMPKMKSELNLIADESGEFRGSSANLSGSGFARMNFIAKATTPLEYKQWLEKIKGSEKTLSYEEYGRLAEPSVQPEREFFQLKEDKLFDKVLMKYMEPKET